MKRFLGILLALVCCVSFAACGKGNGDQATKDSAAPAASATDAPASSSSVAADSAASEAGQNAAADAAAAPNDAQQNSGNSGSASAGAANTSGAKFESIDAYLNDPKVKASIDEKTEAVSDSFTMKVYADAGTLVYEYNYVTHIEEASLEATASALETSLEENADTFITVIDELKKYVAIESPQVRVVYNNDDGTTIVQKTFTS